MNGSQWLPTVAVFGLAGLMCGVFAAGVRATQQATKPHNHCLNGCGKGETPEKNKCCQPPTCEFNYELKVAQANVRSVAKAKTQMAREDKQLGGVSGVDLGSGSFQGIVATTVMERFLDLKKQALDKEAARFPACGSQKAYVPVEPFKVDPYTCAILGKAGNPVTLEQAKDADERCREVVEAAYKYAEKEKARCERVKKWREDFPRERTDQNFTMGGRHFIGPDTPEERQKTKLEAAQAAKKSLLDSLNQFYYSCKKFGKSKSAQASAKQALTTLLASGRTPTPPPKRAAGSGRGKSS